MSSGEPQLAPPANETRRQGFHATLRAQLTRTVVGAA